MPESQENSLFSTPPVLPIPPSSEPSRIDYVYPVRSLLSGRIQPATDPVPAQIDRNESMDMADLLLPPREHHISNPFRTSSQTPYWTKDHTDAVMRSVELWREAGPSTHEDEVDPRSTSAEKPAAPSASRRRRRTKRDSQSLSDKSTVSRTRRYTRHEHAVNKNSPNFRHFPAEDNSNLYGSRSFSSRIAGLPRSSSPPLASMETIMTGPSPVENLIGPSNRFSATSTFEAEWSQTQLPTSSSNTHSTAESSSPSLEPTTSPLPFNPSEYGIVHLPPLALTSTPEVTEQGESNNYPPTLANSKSSLSHPTSDEPSKQQPFMNTSGSSPATGTRSESVSGSASDSVNTAVSTEPLVSFRYEHAQDENGNHVVIGREGELQRCEDEPIRTPGAVQAFGVLIAVEELEDSLVVRQVSENSTELLGLSPRFLFSLECFTDTLPDAQASVLWDNIQYLSQPNLDEEDDAEGPHVFLVSGWGAPGSSPPDLNNGRRHWTCWCAVHRPAAGNDHSPTSPSLIIMEFELERDALNPLYPSATPQQPLAASSLISPDTLSTDGSEQTIVADDVTSGLGGGSSTDSGTTNQLEVPSNSSTPPADPTSSLITTPRDPITPESLGGLEGPQDWSPSAEDIIESTISRAKPLPALERLRRITKAGVASTATDVDPPVSPTGTRSRRGKHRAGKENPGVGMMDVFAVMGQINEQLGAASTLDDFLKVVVGVIQDLTQFHRVLVYQFDESWNGQVVAELVDWSQTRDLYKGLHFPATDIPAQARTLYAINKVRLLYDRSQPTARIVVKSKADIDIPLNMSHCYLRAMSPIHIKYLANMGVRASMSVSIMGFGALWGLVTCHSYGAHGMRVSFPVRQMLRLLSQSISRNIERLSYAQRLHTRKLINTMVSDRHPTGYIVSNADDLLGLFDADFGILVIGEGAKILGPNQHGQEILIMAEYLRLKQFNTIQASQAVTNDFPDLQLTTGFEIIAGLLYVPLSSGGKDFIAFLRKGQPRHVHWAGKPYKDGAGAEATLEPRKSFKIWSETIAGRCRAWTDEQLETAGVLALVYGKFIEVWRQKESALQTTKLTNLLLSNASHEVRTPLNHIINYLEMALNGPLDEETRDNLSRSHAASKSLLFTINDLLDLTRLESGNETSFNEPFDLQFAIEEATHLYKKEAERRDVKFILELHKSPRMVVGDAKKIRTVVQNLTANSLKCTSRGSITVHCTTFGEPEGLRPPSQTAVEIVVADTGCGIPPDKLEHIFREFEQVESSEPKASGDSGVGLGLAVVARIVEQLGGQLRVNSKVDEGSSFSFLIPLALTVEDESGQRSISPHQSDNSRSSINSVRMRARSISSLSGSEIENLVEALASNHMSGGSIESSPRTSHTSLEDVTTSSTLVHHTTPGTFGVAGSQVSVRPVKIDNFSLDISMTRRQPSPRTSVQPSAVEPPPSAPKDASLGPAKLRVLIVEDNDINRTVLAKRLRIDGHTVVNTTNGQEGLNTVESDRSFDIVLMDIQMPILNGFEATQEIRKVEKASCDDASLGRRRLSHELNGRIPIFAVSASLLEYQRDELVDYGMDGWILKPIDFRRLGVILRGVTDRAQRERDIYRPGNWEVGGWL